MILDAIETNSDCQTAVMSGPRRTSRILSLVEGGIMYTCKEGLWVSRTVILRGNDAKVEVLGKDGQ